MDNHELVEVDLEEVISRALHMLTNEFKYDYKVVSDLTPHSIILGSEGQLQQVFINFFINAKHAMEEGGTLTVKCFRNKQRIIVTIEDQGHGIAEQDLKEIFTPFFTTKTPGEGTGLGLSISYSILQQHHAKISVTSEVNKGTTFTLSFIAVD